MDTRWITFSPEAEACIKVALMAAIARNEELNQVLQAGLLVPPAESETHVESCRWLDTARLTLQAIENAIATGVQIPFGRDPR